MAFGDIFNSQQNKIQTKLLSTKCRLIVVDTSIDTPAPIDTPTPICTRSSRRNNPSRKHIYRARLLNYAKAKEKSSFDEALRKKNQ
jgi:hypothetical protein